MTLRSFAVILLGLPFAGAAFGDTSLVADHFNSISSGASTFNSTLAVDQSGILAPVTYTVTGYSKNSQIQHGNNGQMLLNGWNGSVSKDLYVSLNHNFAAEANSYNQPLKVQFNLSVTSALDPTNWATIAIGSAQNAYVTNPANKFSSLFRLNGETQQFASGSAVSGSGFSWTSAGSVITVILSDTAGSGSPFNGHGSVAGIYVNGVLAGTYTLAQMTAADGYVSFETSGAYTRYDNLSVSVASSSYSLVYNGNGSTGGSVPVDANAYAPGASATVLGGSTLVRSGYAFTHWNTAANGTGTSYNPGDTLVMNSSTTLYAQWRLAGVTWNNGAGTGNWNSTDANWTGLVWNNAQTYHAYFTTVGGTINLTQPITAGSVNFGNASLNVPNITFTNGSLTAANLTVQGNGSNGSGYSTNPNLTLAVPTVAVAGDLAAGRATLVIASGTVTANRITSAASSADWGAVVINGGTVTATNGVDGSVNTTATFQLDLNGGALYTPYIKVADREFGGNAWLNFNGTVVHPTVSTNHFITLYGGTQNTYVGNGGAVFDTDGHDIGIGVNLIGSGSGGLIKSGAGTLTLSGQNSYIGATSVQGGALSLTGSSAVSSSSVMDITNGAMVHLNFPGSATVGGLRLNGVTQPAGVYGAGTHPAFFTGTGQLVVPEPFTNALAAAPNDGIANFRKMKYGLFVHYVWDGNGGGSFNPDGSKISSIDDFANGFDAAAFANAMESMGVEYVIFTAWHANFFPLFNSSAMDKYYPGRCPTRDMVGDMVDAVRAKGIRVLFYTHPMQPITWDYNTYNNMINDVYAELVERYGDRIDGLFLDENDPNGGQDNFVDYPRLRQTIKSRQPDLLMMQNFYGTVYSCDIGQVEYLNYTGTFGQPSGTWPAQTMPIALEMSAGWSPLAPLGANTVRFSAQDMFRYTVLQAGANTDGGGVTWAASPYAGGDVWENGVLPAMMQVGNYIRPIRRSICNTLPSKSWVTPANTSINSIANGIVATRSPDDGTEFIHVLTPPAGNSLTVPAPADGRGYASASLLENGNPVSLVRNGDGSLTLTLQSGDTWNPRDTVIALTPVTVTWNGNSNDAGPGTAAWSDSVDHFIGGKPIATRFRPGDHVDFSVPGAATAIPWASNFAVGDLRFSGKDHLIQPSGSPTITLASGRIDVADGFTASFQETGLGGPLTLAGSSGLSKTGGGTLVLDLPSAVAGNTVLTNGVVAVRSGALGREGNIVFSGGTLRMLPGNQEDFSSRIRHGDAPVKIDTGGNHLVWATPLHSSNTGGLIKLGGGTLSLAGGTATTDSFTIESGTLKLEPATTGVVAVPNAGFESPAYAAQGWSYNPTGTGWNFISSSGTASNNTPWVGTSPEGVQVAYLQNNGSMSTEVTASADGHYRLSFLAANRPGYLASGLVVTLDGVQIGAYLPGHIGRNGNFSRFELLAVRITAGTHTLAFQGQQNGSDSNTLIDDVRFTAAEAGALPGGASLALTGASSVFQPGPAAVTLDALAGVAGSTVDLSGSHLAITGNGHSATFAGSITGSGSLTNSGTLRLVGDATLDFTGPFTNNGVLDIMTWNGTLPAGFVNNGIVLDRSKVRVNSAAKSEASFMLNITGYTGHNYQLQRSNDLSGPWQDVGTEQAGAGAELDFTDTDGAGEPRRFYRIAVSP